MKLWAATPRRNTPDVPDRCGPVNEELYRQCLEAVCPRENRRMRFHGHSTDAQIPINTTRVGEGVKARVLEAVKASPLPITAKMVGENIGIRQQNAATALKELFQQGDLTRTRGTAKRDPYFYEVAE